MNGRTRWFPMLALSMAMVGGVVTSAVAQAPKHKHVLSANPFGLLLELFNAELENVVGESSTAGVGGSMYTSSNDTYLNFDAFWRFYPAAVPDPLNGWAFGIKGGVTNVNSKTYVGAGFDVNRSWLLGKENNFYVGLGFGLKRIFGNDAGLQFVPTFRIVNVGFAF